MQEFKLRSRASLWTGLVSIALISVTVVFEFIVYGFDAVGKSLALAVLGVWASFVYLIRARARVNDAGVLAVNPLRTVNIPWGQIIEVRTNTGLEIITNSKRFRVSAGVAPGRRAVARADKDSFRSIAPSEGKTAGFIEPGDILESDSGALAYVIRMELHARTENNYSNMREIEIKWHWGSIVLGSGLIILTAAILLLG